MDDMNIIPAKKGFFLVERNSPEEVDRSGGLLWTRTPIIAWWITILRGDIPTPITPGGQAGTRYVVYVPGGRVYEIDQGGVGTVTTYTNLRTWIAETDAKAGV